MPYDTGECENSQETGEVTGVTISQTFMFSTHLSAILYQVCYHAKRREETMARIEVDEFFCKGCGLCTTVCPKHILELNPEVITDKGYHPAHSIDQSACTGCATCAVMCPDVAITVWR